MPHVNPEKHTTVVAKVRLQGKMDYLGGLEMDPMRHYYKPGGSDEFHYFNGYDREFRDCVSAVMGIQGKKVDF